MIHALKRLYFPLFALVFLLSAGCRSVAPAASAHPLPTLMAERLIIAREVAWTKLHSGAAVHDPAREAALLADLVAQGHARGLDPSRVEAFFVAQISASREVQHELLAAWAAGAPHPAHAPLDLRADIRPSLDTLTPRLLDALPAQPEPTLARVAETTLREAGFSAAVTALAVEPLRR